MVLYRVLYWVDSNKVIRSVYWEEIIDSDYVLSRDGYLFDRNSF